MNHEMLAPSGDEMPFYSFFPSPLLDPFKIPLFYLLGGSYQLVPSIRLNSPGFPLTHMDRLRAIRKLSVVTFVSWATYTSRAFDIGDA